MLTGEISYNIKDRGRKHSGIDRNFNVAEIVAAVNSPECQERVKLRDMIGYYGHWPRIRFGMNPAEGGLDSGAAVAVEPAIVTTTLRADPDGTIHHKAEFLPTKAGKLAAKLWSAKTGGFSSAIDVIKNKFFGFDYVLNANFATNRGFSLDSVSGDMTLDAVDVAIYDEQLAGMQALLDSSTMLQQSAAMALESMGHKVAHLESENAEYLSMVTKLQREKEQQETGVLDDLTTGRPLMLSGKNEAQRLRQLAHEFRHTDLIMPDQGRHAGRAVVMPESYDYMLSRYS